MVRVEIIHSFNEDIVGKPSYDYSKRVYLFGACIYKLYLRDYRIYEKSEESEDNKEERKPMGFYNAGVNLITV